MLLILPLVARGRGEGPLVPGNFVVVRTIDSAFLHTQNLHQGVGILAANHARRPAVPAMFHSPATGNATETPGVLANDPQLGLWTLAQTPSRHVFFADAKKALPAGHAFVTSTGDGLPSRTKTDVAFLAGSLKGVAYASDVALGSNGAGTIEATGNHPLAGRYALVGCWGSSNVGSWNQRWSLADGSSETDAYRNKPDGTSALRIATSRGINLDLAFGVDLSGSGTVTGEADGLPAKVAWDARGDGTVTWADGSRTEFEDFKFGAKL